jgi:prevent-host-death family protein
VNVIGLFEAKTKFSEICNQVAAKGIAVVVTRRGKPLVRIEPIRSASGKPKGVWDFRAEHEMTHGPLTEEFALPEREPQTWHSPLDRE